MTKYEELLGRANAYGMESMSTAELIQLIIGGGGKGESSFRVAEEIASDYGLNLKAARARNFGDLYLMTGQALTRRQEAKLLSAMELARRVNSDGVQKQRITSPGDASNYFMPMLRNATHEYFYCMMLNTKNQIMAVRKISEGSLSASIVHPREVLAPAIAFHASSILVAHNHPSGNPHPSADDKHLTETLNSACDVMGIPLMDHIVIGDGIYYSFKEHGDF